METGRDHDTTAGRVKSFTLSLPLLPLAHEFGPSASARSTIISENAYTRKDHNHYFKTYKLFTAEDKGITFFNQYFEGQHGVLGYKNAFGPS